MHRRLTTAFLLFAALALPILVAAGRAAEPDNPHAFMADVYRCVDCHETVPREGIDDWTNLTFTKDIVTLCEECHPALLGADKHPVDIRPEFDVPDDLHLDSYFSITCVTCHDPHGEAWSDFSRVPRTWLDNIVGTVRGEDRYRTYFLRRSNAEGELCRSCHRQRDLVTETEHSAPAAADLYTGSERCRECHPAEWEQWRLSVHARYVGEPSRDPAVLLAEFRDGKPFDPAALLYTLGQHWTQRFVVRGEKEPMVRPEIWSIQSGEWISSGTYSRSWHRYCAGCHVTAFDPYKGTFVEKGIGCEACHGPGLEHTRSTDQFDIVNPARLTPERRDMVCESCHTSGHDRSGQFRFPIGYRPGDDLTKYFKGLVPKPGQEADSYSGDGSYEDRHRQFHFWMSRYNITQGILCDVCKNFRQSINPESDEVFLSSSEFCATCHRWYWENALLHSRHDSSRAECIDCHTPAITVGGREYSIHDHKFQFGEPVRAENVTLEERCRGCHAREVAVAALEVRRAP